ncbi:MAG: M56 family metallopeptidase [Terriglobales bacterium]
MISPTHLVVVAETLANGMLVCIAGGVPIAFFAWAGLRIWGRHSSGAKFAVLYSALLAISLLPLVGRIRSSAGYAVNGGPSGSLITVSSSWAVFVFAVWSIFAAVALLRVIIGMVKLRTLRRNCRSIDAASLEPVLQQTLGELRCGRGVELRISDELSVPTAIGFFKPLVILPAWALQDLSVSQLRPVLLHELAHVRRWDDWTNLLQKIIHAVLFFHPAVWWIEKRISLEREMACDDVVLAHTGNPRAYAQSLLSVAEKSFVRRGFSLAQAAVSRMRQTSARVAQILDGNRKRSKRTWKPVSLLLASSFFLGFAVLPRVPDIVRFTDGAPSTVAKFDLARKAPESSIQVPAVPAPVPRGQVHRASFKTKHIFAPAGREDQSIVSHSVIEAKFPSNRRNESSLRSKNSTTTRQALVTRTVLVVTRFRGDGESPEFWTVHVWQLTVFEPNTASQNTLPAKKV